MFNSLIFGLFFACGEKENDTSDDTGSVEAVDADGDGFVETDDCDDSNAAINPGAEELCDGVDNNCDEEIDNDATDALTFYEDYDEDGFGDASITEDACEAPEGFVDNMDDCDDLEATVNPDATEVCDTLDNDCDELIDDADDSLDATTGTLYYADADSDGFGDEAVSVQACAPVVGYVSNMNDCDDAVENVDGDGDGFLDCKGDCDDADATTFPGAAESESETDCMRDADEDGYGDLSPLVDLGCWTLSGSDSYGDGWNGSAYIDVVVDGASIETFTVAADTNEAEVCLGSGSSVDFVYVEGTWTSENSYTITSPEGTVAAEGTPADGILFSFSDDSIAKGTDCDDSDPAVGSGDVDGDGYDACDVDNPTDCDDTDPAINPGVDADEDGFNMCIDCNEGDPAINPGADEIWYDGVDQNCDGWSDFDMDMDGSEALSYPDPADASASLTGPGYDCDDDDSTLLALSTEADATLCYSDDDGDGYGDDSPSSTETAAGAVPGTDCDDYLGFFGPGGEHTYPGAAENETDPTLCMEDVDGDGYGAVAGTYDDFVSGTDCDDDDADKNPSIDADSDTVNSCEDCDDTDSSLQGLMGYTDNDGDGYGSDSSGVVVCDLDTDGDTINDLVAEGGDCDDYDEFTFPGAGYLEQAPLNEECLTDFDEDGYAATIPGIYEVNVVTGDCLSITIEDSYGDGCNGSVDLYADGTYVISLVGPTVSTVTYEQCAIADGFWQAGWTQATSFNSECSFSVSDDQGNVLFESTGTLPSVVPGGGTDSDDNDNTTW